MRLPRVMSPQMHRRIDLVALPSVIASVVGMSRRNNRAAALMSMIAAGEGAALLTTDYPPGFLRWMASATTYGQLPCTGSLLRRSRYWSGYPVARSARPARACFDADRSERAERHTGTVAPFMMSRRPMMGRIGCGGTTGNASRFRRCRGWRVPLWTDLRRDGGRRL